MTNNILNRHTAPKAEAPERVIQFGEGNFLRAFVDWMIQEMNDKTAFNGSVVIVQPRERNHIETLRAQDCLYHVNLLGLKGNEQVNTCQRISSVSRALNPYTQYDAFMALAEQPEIRFVISNTTEAGIAFDNTCKLSDTPPASYPAKLTQLLYRRYSCFNGDTKKGLIILPCELIFANGHHLKDCINQYIDLWHDDLDDAEGFRKWIACCCPICTTLVDRIVNGYPHNDEQQLWQRIGYKDAAMVQGEIFHLWVIEHDKNISIEQLDEEWPARKAGLNVVLTDNEVPYHLRKTTLLNGPHTVLSPVAFLSGINIVRDACNDELVGKFIHQVMFNELLPTLELPQDELTRFAEDVLQRFKNPYIDHQVTSIMLNSFPKFKTRDLPALKRYTELKGELPKAIVLGLAAITTYYKGGTREDGTAITPNDDPAILELLQQLWASADCHTIAEGVLGAQDLIWKEQGNLNDIPGLTDLLASYLQQIQESGMRKTIETVLNK